MCFTVITISTGRVRRTGRTRATSSRASRVFFQARGAEPLGNGDRGLRKHSSYPSPVVTVVVLQASSLVFLLEAEGAWEGEWYEW